MWTTLNRIKYLVHNHYNKETKSIPKSRKFPTPLKKGISCYCFNDEDHFQLCLFFLFLIAVLTSAFVRGTNPLGNLWIKNKSVSIFLLRGVGKCMPVELST